VAEIKKRKSRSKPEQALQKAFVKFAHTQRWGAFLMRIGNENELRSHLKTPEDHARYSNHVHCMGLLVGASDLFLAYPNKTSHGLWIECKAPGEKLKPEQAQFLNKMKENGYNTLASDSIKELVDYTIAHVRNV
jgi:hypothetical protein